MSNEPYTECLEGWKGLYKPLIDLCELYDLTILQVKEKFGGLRFYATGERLMEVIQLFIAAEARSYHICEVCGEDGIDGYDGTGKPVYRVTTAGVGPSGGWLKTLCQPCREKW